MLQYSDMTNVIRSAGVKMPKWATSGVSKGKLSCYKPDVGVGEGGGGCYSIVV